MNRIMKILIAAAVIAATAVVSSFLTLQFLALPDSRVQIDVVSRKMDEVGRYLEAYFIDEYDPEALEAAAADGAAAAMVSATGDRWSYYIPAANMQEYEEQMANAYVGVGISILPVEEGIEIVEVTPNGPAHKAGLQPGDIVVGVDGTDIAGLDVDTVADMVGGPEGTTVRLTMLREDRTTELELTRAEILLPVATGMMVDDKIGLVRIENFDAHCANETLRCVDELLQGGASALIFDLRFNGGGYKTEMVEVLDALLPEGLLFRSRDYADREEKLYSDAEYLDIPMAVLVNEDTYSAAEFFAAALQEYEAALVIGTQTTGKGNFQYTFDLSDGSAVVLSAGKYYTPGGRSLTDIGVTPDIAVELTDEDYYALYAGTLEYAEDEQLQEAIAAMRAKIS